jgi:hypothetical protein
VSEIAREDEQGAAIVQASEPRGQSLLHACVGSTGEDRQETEAIQSCLKEGKLDLDGMLAIMHAADRADEVPLRERAHLAVA